MTAETVGNSARNQFTQHDCSVKLNLHGLAMVMNLVSYSVFKFI